MIVKREKLFIKRINKISKTIYDIQKIKRTSFLLLGIFPLYIKDEIISGNYEG